MKTFNLRFTLSTDVVLPIEAETEEDAIDQLYELQARDIIDDGCIQGSMLGETEVESITEAHERYKVKCTEIDYDLDDDVDDSERASLPEELILDKVYVDAYDHDISEEDIEEAIGDEISAQTGYCVNSFKYTILD